MNIPVLRNMLKKNEEDAGRNRTTFDQNHVLCINILGGAGCGKTSLLEAVLPKITTHLRVAVLEGDIATTRDAERIAAVGVRAVQLLTDGGCHLSATLVRDGLDAVPLADLDLVIIENVGNPICPANFDLGEHARIGVLSLTEGDDKPAKYPLLFKEADLVVLTKYDLQPYTDFDIDSATCDLRRMNKEVEIIVTDIRTSLGIDSLTEWITSRVRSIHESRSVGATAR